MFLVRITEELLGSIVEGASKERDKTKRFLDEKSQQYTKLIQSLQVIQFINDHYIICYTLYIDRTEW